MFYFRNVTYFQVKQGIQLEKIISIAFIEN